MRAALILTSLVVAAVGSAQNVANAPYLTVAERGAYLLAAENIRAELKLSRDQVADIEQAFDILRDRQTKEANLPQPNADRLRDFERAFAKSAWAVLDRKASDRLFGLTLQRIGIRALGDADVAQRLGVSKTHSKEIAQAFAAWDLQVEDLESRLGELIASKLPDDPKEKQAAEARRKVVIDSFDLDRKRLNQDRTRIESMSLAGLTLDERNRWLSAQGTPFEFWKS